jgi:thiol-disulfide isomerase/thioredoxin
MRLIRSILWKAVAVVSAFGLFHSCRHEPSTLSAPGNVVKNGPIILVFIEPPVNRHIKLGAMTSGYATHEISYVTDSLIAVQKTLGGRSGDTLVISTNREFVEVEHIVKGFSQYSYLLSPGDTIYFTYNGLIPTASRRIGDVYDAGLNYDALKNRLVYRDTFSTMTTLKAFIIFSAVGSSPSVENTIAMFDHLKNRMGEDLTREKKFLDSLGNGKLISSAQYAFYDQKLRFELQLASAYQTNFWFIRQPLDDALARDSQEKLKAAHHDSLLYYSYYKAGTDLLYLINSRKVARVVRTNGELMPTSGSNVPNFQMLYDTLKYQDMPVNLREHLLFTAMKDIVKYSAVNDVKEYRQRFRQDVTNNAAYEKFLVDNFNLDNGITSEIGLTDFNRIKTNLKEVLAKHKGKVVLIDFWASWCGPCLVAMPTVIDIENKLNKKGVVVIFISQDENLDRWNETVGKYKVPKRNSYVITNLRTSEFFEKMNIPAIPHYLIYDQDGKLVHPNAPSPTSGKLEESLLRYL